MPSLRSLSWSLVLVLAIGCGSGPSPADGGLPADSGPSQSDAGPPPRCADPRTTFVFPSPRWETSSGLQVPDADAAGDLIRTLSWEDEVAGVDAWPRRPTLVLPLDRSSDAVDPTRVHLAILDGGNWREQDQPFTVSAVADGYVSIQPRDPFPPDVREVLIAMETGVAGDAHVIGACAGSDPDPAYATAAGDWPGSETLDLVVHLAIADSTAPLAHLRERLASSPVLTVRSSEAAALADSRRRGAERRHGTSFLVPRGARTARAAGVPSGRRRPDDPRRRRRAARAGSDRARLRGRAAGDRKRALSGGVLPARRRRLADRHLRLRQHTGRGRLRIRGHRSARARPARAARRRRRFRVPRPRQPRAHPRELPADGRRSPRGAGRLRRAERGRVERGRGRRRARSEPDLLHGHVARRRQRQHDQLGGARPDRLGALRRRRGLPGAPALRPLRGRGELHRARQRAATQRPAGGRRDHRRRRRSARLCAGGRGSELATAADSVPASDSRIR